MKTEQEHDYEVCRVVHPDAEMRVGDVVWWDGVDRNGLATITDLFPKKHPHTTEIRYEGELWYADSRNFRHPFPEFKFVDGGWSIDYEELGFLIDAEYEWYAISETGEIMLFQRQPHIYNDIILGCWWWLVRETEQNEDDDYGVSLLGLNVHNKPGDWRKSLRKIERRPAQVDPVAVEKGGAV